MASSTLPKVVPTGLAVTLQLAISALARRHGQYERRYMMVNEASQMIGKDRLSPGGL